MKKDNFNIDTIKKDIQSYNSISIKDFFDLINKYNETMVLMAFKDILSNLSYSDITKKYCDVYIYFTTDLKRLDDSSFSSLCQKFGEDNVVSFLAGLPDEIKNKHRFIKSMFDSDSSSEFFDKDGDDVDIDYSLDDNYNLPSSVSFYINQIGRIPLLTTEESKELLYKIKDGDVKAKKKFIEANLRLVVSIAKRYQVAIADTSITFNDLIQEGNIGLMKAVEKFLIEKNCRFSTYATWWIKQSIIRFLADNKKIIRIPAHLIESMNLINKATRILTIELGRTPTNEEIAKYTKIPISKINDMSTISALNDFIFLDAPAKEIENDHPISETIYNPDDLTIEEQISKSDVAEKVNEAINALSFREAEVIRLRFGFYDGKSYTLEDIGVKLGVTRERVRQIEEKALRKFKSPAKKKYFKDIYYDR